MTAAGMVVALLAVVLAACGSDSPADQAAPSTTLQPRSGGTLSFGIETDLNGLDPTRNAWDPVSLQVANALYDTLFAFDSDGKAQPYALASAEHNAEFTSWTLRLRPELTFHNGRTATGEDLTRSIRAYRDSWVTGQAAENIIDATTIDALTTRIDMKRPWATYPAILTTQGGTLLPVEQIEDPYGHSNPIGTGPFKLQRWDMGNRVSLVRNPSYWRSDASGVQLPYLDAVTFEIVNNPAREREMLRAGELDVFQTRLGSVDSPLDELAAAGEIAVEHDPGATETSFVLLNTAKPPLNDVRIRRAMSYAIDLEGFAERFGWPRDRLTNTPLPPTSPFHADVEFPRADADRARQLVEDYKRETGTTPTITLTTSETGLAELLQTSWNDVGIVTTLEVTPIKQTVLNAVAGFYDAMLFAYYASTDVDTLYGFWHSATVRPIGEIGLNYPRFADAEIDRALDEGRASPDESVRRAAYVRLQTRFAETVPYIWLARLDWIIARRTNVHNARNVTLPDGQPAAPFESGVFRLTETWLAAS
jgi:peptide/nickel transport system substrate-binding protein